MSGLITPTVFGQVAPHAAADVLAPALDSAGTSRLINAPLRVAHWLAQLHVETQGFTRFEENLNYSAERLMVVWPHRFPTLEAATPFAHNPEALANRTYGNRMGNTQPGDGWRYRGRGAGLTGRSNYASIGALIGVDLIGQPDLAATPPVFAEVAAVYWQTHNLNPVADRDDIAAITEAWNGGLIGLPDRRAALASYKAALGVPA